MKLRYKLSILIAAIGGIAYLNVWLGVTGIIFFFAWCVVQAGKSFNDDCMMDEEQYGRVKKEVKDESFGC